MQGKIVIILHFGWLRSPPRIHAPVSYRAYREESFCHTFFGPDTKWRFRPSFFPFTEPSCEVDILWVDKKGSESWMEVGGCGMVDPNVFDAVGIDSEK